MKRLALTRFMIPAVLCLSLAGCSTWAEHGIRVRPEKKLKVAILPVECTVPIRNLKAIRTIPKAQAPPADEEEQIRNLIAQATREMTTSLEKRVGDSALLEVVSPDEVAGALRDATIPADGKTLTPDRIRDLGERLRADAVLHVRMPGYGKIKKKWQVYLVGSGMVEALVEGAAAYKIAGSRGWGITVAAEEAAQEFLTWVGGVALFNKFFTPVILEAGLYNTSDGRMFWSKTVIAVGRKKDFKTLPEEERKLKEVRLRIVREKAVVDLMKALEKKALKNAGR